jgi:prepilin-type N-terminal cleavage/methylation domain-containing protein
MSSNRGLTLTEMMVAVAVGGILLWVGSRLLVDQRKFVIESTNRLSAKSDIGLVSRTITKALSKDLKYMAFTGQPAGAGDYVYYRFLVPLPGVSRGLNYRLPNDTTLVFADFDSATQATIKVLCSADAGYNSLLVDMAQGQRGSVSFNQGTSSFNVTNTAPGEPTGPVKLDQHSTFAILNPPLASMWVVDGQATNYTLFNTDQPSGPIGLNPECLPRMRVTSNYPSGRPIYATDNLVRIPIRAFAISSLSGTPSNVEPRGRMDHLQSLPLWLAPIKIKSVGTDLKAAVPGATLLQPGVTPLDTPTNQLPQNIMKTFGVSECRLGQVANRPNDLRCDLNLNIAEAGPIFRTRLEMGFRVNLDSTNSNPVKNRYEILRAQPQAVSGGERHGACSGDSECGIMRTHPFVHLCGVDYMWSSRLPLSGTLLGDDCGDPLVRETAGMWRTDYYSLIKNAVASKLIFRVTLPQGAGDETLTINLP